MKHFWIVEFLHPLGWTPYSLHLSRKEARDQAAIERNRWLGKFKIRYSKAMRADKSEAGAK